MKLIINTDGGARGNPGPGACAFVAQDSAGNLLEKCGKYLGTVTNNVAEYQAVIEALKWIKGNWGDRGNGGNQGKIEEIVIKSDSLLLVSQLTGQWKIKDRDLQQLVLEVKLLEAQLNMKVKYMYVPREANREADREVNKVLDLHG